MVEQREGLTVGEIRDFGAVIEPGQAIEDVRLVPIRYGCVAHVTLKPTSSIQVPGSTIDVDGNTVDVVTTGIREIVADGIVTDDGAHHPADAIICGTGFQVNDVGAPFEVRGIDGADLGEAGVTAALGVDEAAEVTGAGVSGWVFFFGAKYCRPRKIKTKTTEKTSSVRESCPPPPG